MPGPDHKASLEPEELQAMVQAIRMVEQAMGSGVKIPAADEVANINVVRKSLVAASEIAEGEKITLEKLTAKRAGAGISPMDVWHILDKRADRAYEADEKIKW